MTTTKQDSFLHDTQIEGRSTGGKLPIEFLDEAIESVHMIMNKEVLPDVHGKKTEDIDAIKMALYCHDCNAIVPAGIGKGRKGKMRTVCGSCTSRKISSGRVEALEKFYHISKDKEPDAPRRRSFPPKKKKNFKKR